MTLRRSFYLGLLSIFGIIFILLLYQESCEYSDASDVDQTLDQTNGGIHFEGERSLLTGEKFTKQYLSLSDEVAKLEQGKKVAIPLLHHKWNERVSLPPKRKKIFIGVVTAEKYLLTRAKTIYNTWAQNVKPDSKLCFFVGENSNISHPDLKKLPIIKLKGLLDGVYPPMEKVFGLFQYFYREFGQVYEWFVRADDDVYIRMDTLETLLDSLDWTKSLYIGSPGYGQVSYRKVLKLLPNENYCMGGPGIVYSAAALKEIYPHLGSCLKDILEYNVQVPEGMRWVYDDVELGRCSCRKIALRCTPASKKDYFYNDYTKEVQNYNNLKRSKFRDVATIHPLKESKNMLEVHHFYTSLRLATLKSNKQHVLNAIRETCKDMKSNDTSRTLTPCQN